MKPISTPDAPAAIGPYSQAVLSGSLLFVSGQIPLDPTTGELVSEDIKEQTHCVLRNLRAVVEAGGSSLAHVVKTTVFLTDLNDFQLVNAIYANYFDTQPPARSTIQVTQLPKSARVEIDAIAIINNGV